MKVAVKVLTGEDLTESARRQFMAEANAMAELADHPSIVQVFRADVTADGRPYLVMKYYPHKNLSVRARGERFAVSDVLRIGVQISDAVETAHRAGILHRDIKPANILTGQFGATGLADFGLAVTKGIESSEDSNGMSVPWAPPEVIFATSEPDERSDVYSLGATLWHLLEGHSPFMDLGGDNSQSGLSTRIQNAAPPSTGRSDVPDSLERLLQQAMAKNPSRRPQSALALARALQGIEQELHWTVTPILVDRVDRKSVRSSGSDDDHGATQHRPLERVQLPPALIDGLPLPLSMNRLEVARPSADAQNLIDEMPGGAAPESPTAAAPHRGPVPNGVGGARRQGRDAKRPASDGHPGNVRSRRTALVAGIAVVAIGTTVGVVLAAPSKSSKLPLQTAAAASSAASSASPSSAAFSQAAPLGSTPVSGAASASIATSSSAGTTPLAVPARCTTTPSEVPPDFTQWPARTSDQLKVEPTISLPAGPVPAGLKVVDLIVGQGRTLIAQDFPVDGRLPLTMFSVGNEIVLNYADCKTEISTWARGVPTRFQGTPDSVPPESLFGSAGIPPMKVGGRREIITPSYIGGANVLILDVLAAPPT